MVANTGSPLNCRSRAAASANLFVLLMCSKSSMSAAPSDPMAMEDLRKKRSEQSSEVNDALDRLHSSVLQTQDRALRMNKELADQDRLLSNLGDGVDAANQDARAQTQSITQLLQQSRHGGFIFTVVALLLIILLLLWL